MQISCESESCRKAKACRVTVTHNLLTQPSLSSSVSSFKPDKLNAEDSTNPNNKNWSTPTLCNCYLLISIQPTGQFLWTNKKNIIKDVRPGMSLPNINDWQMSRKGQQVRHYQIKRFRFYSRHNTTVSTSGELCFKHAQVCQIMRMLFYFWWLKWIIPEITPAEQQPPLYSTAVTLF